MDPFTIAMMAGGAAVQLGASLFGYLKNQGKEKEAQRILAAAGGSFDNISVPELEKIVAEQLGPTELSKIKADPQLRQAQMDTLGKMGDLEKGGGFNDEDRANLNRLRSDVARRESGQRQLLTDNMAARGMGGSGAELAMQLANSQGAADRNMQAGLDVASQAQKRYFDAIRARNQMAGGMRDQDYSEQARAAEAQDAINRFNLGHRYDVAQYNNGLAQQNYQNQVGLADRKYNVAKDRADELRGQADRSRQFWGQVGYGVNDIASGVAKARQAGQSQYSLAEPGSDEERKAMGLP